MLVFKTGFDRSLLIEFLEAWYQYERSLHFRVLPQQGLDNLQSFGCHFKWCWCVHSEIQR